MMHLCVLSRSMRVSLLHPRAAGSSEKFLRILRKPLRASLRAEVVRLAVMLDFARRFGWVHRHSTDRIFCLWATRQSRQTCGVQFRIGRRIRHVAILDDSGLHLELSGICRGWYNSRMTLVEVTYELQSPLSEEQLRHLGEFANIYGLRRFRLDDSKKQLSFEYDASRLRETQVAHALGQAKIAVTRKVN